MTLKLRTLAPVLALALSACDRPPEPPRPTTQPPGVAKAPVGPAYAAVYACTDGRMVSAAYNRRYAGLQIAGRSYRLIIARSASGVRYVGDGLQWWTRGLDQSRLSAFKPGETVPSDPGVECRRQGAAPAAVQPPALGTPGGLPDDRTPVSEAPFQPQSAQGAADVVQTYFADLGAKQYAKAWALWGDGGRRSGHPTADAFARSFDRYAQYDAEVGAPGDQEGAAGSSYVTVPVVIYGRLKTGAEVHEKGEATLRRVNDVPGSTAEQRRWHIDRIETKPSS